MRALKHANDLTAAYKLLRYSLSKNKQSEDKRMFPSKYKTIVAAFAFAALTPSAALSFDEFGEFQHFSEVEVTTPSNMRQSIKDTPGAITVIDAKQIRNLGIRNIPDILRLVPGFHVDISSPFAYANRGSAESAPRRLQVLIDGVSEVNPLVGIVNWENVPVPIERIAFVEIVRSQSSSTYGANAFYGTINFITKRNSDDVGNTVNVTASDRGHTAYAKTGFEVGNTAIVVSVKQSKHDNFDEWLTGQPFDEEMDVKKANISSQTKIGDDELTLRLAVVRGAYESPLSASPLGMEIPPIDLDSVVFSASYVMNVGNHEIEIQGSYYDKEYDQDWRICGPKFYFMPELGQLYRDNGALIFAALQNQPLPSATPEQLGSLNNIFVNIMTDPDANNVVCGDAVVNYQYRTNSLSINDVWTVNDQWKISSAFNMSYMWIDSTTYGNGKTNLKKSRVFSNVEYMPNNWVTFNAGVMAEYFTNEFSGHKLSPRVGANFHLTEDQTVKLLWSQGKRLIDGIEIIEYNQVPVYLDQEIYGSTTQTPFVGYFPLYGNKDHVEEIESYEIVYYANISNINIELRYFEENLDNILNYQDLTTIPITDIKRTGGEFTAQFNHIGDVDVRVSGHYIDSRSTNDVESEDYHAYGGSMYVIKQWDDFVTSLGYYGTSPVRFSSYDRLDARISKPFKFDGVTVDASLMVSHHRETYQRSQANDGGVRDDENEIIFGLEANF